MRKFFRVAALGLALASLSLAQEAPDPFLAERLLAQNALVHLSIPQTATLAGDYEKSNLSKLIHHPEVRPFITSFETWWKRRKTQAVQVGGEALPSYNDQLRAMIGLSVDELWDALQGPLSFTLYDVPLSDQHKLDLVLTLGTPDPAKLEKAAAALKERMKANNDTMKEGEYARAGATIREVGDGGFRLFYTLIQKTLIVATSQQRIEQIVDAAADPAFAGLKEDPAYKAARARVAPENRHFFLLYANVGQALRQYRRELGDDALKALEAFGLADIPSLAMALDYDGPFIRERYALMTSRQDRGILKIIAGGVPADPFAARVPADALSYSRMSLNLAETLDVIRAASKANPDFQKAMEDMLGSYEKRVGFKLREAFGAVGSSWTSWAALPPGGGLWPDSISAVSLIDPVAFESALEKSLTDAGLHLEELPFRGRKIRYFTVGLEQLMGGPGILPLPEFFSFGVTFCYTIEDKSLFVSSHPMALKRLILRSGEKGPSVVDSPKFTALSARLGAGAPDSLSYVDVGRTGMILYGALEPFAHLMRDMPRDEAGDFIVDLARLPLEETLTDLVGGALITKRTAEDGIVIESRSNTGASLGTGVGLVAVGAAVAIPFALRMGGHSAPGGIAGNEMVAELSLQFIRNAEDTFKNSDSDANGVADYWTRDLAGLHSLKDRSGQAIFLLDRETAAADPDGAVRYGLTVAPKNGYFYKMMVGDPDGETYQKDDGKTNKNRYGVVAWPAVPGATGRFTFITNESGKTWKKDTQGQPVDKWPGKDPAKDGWTLAE